MMQAPFLQIFITLKLYCKFFDQKCVHKQVLFKCERDHDFR